VLSSFFFCLAIAAAPAAPAAAPEQDPLWRRALALHHRALVVDTHSDTTSRMLDDATQESGLTPGFDVGRRFKDGHMDLPRMKEGGIDAEFFAIYVAKEYAPSGAARRAMEMIDSVDKMLTRYPDRIQLARSAGDVRRIAQRGRIAALLGIEGGHAIEDSLGALRIFWNLGVRYMTLTHTNSNSWCDSSGDEPRWRGLNELGRRVVHEMNRIGMIVDVSHVSDDAFWAVMETTSAPAIASHSSCRALCNHPRNMSDDMIRALARNGGVIQINFNSGFLDDSFNEATKLLRSRLRAAAEASLRDDPEGLAKELERISRAVPDTPPPLSKLIDHIDHAVKLAGADHVGLGSDFDGVPSVPAGMEDCTKLPAITYELLERGYRDEDVVKILGGNTLRVLEAVERESRRLTAAERN
jgi:membrane dipeptidase